MKKHLLFLELCLISVFLLLPPIFQKTNINNSFTWKISVFHLLQFSISIALYFEISHYIFPKITKINNEKESTKKLKTFLIFANILSTFGFLLLSSVVFESLSFIFKIKSTGVISAPNGFLEYFSCFMIFAIGALYEEIMYRFFLPNAILELLSPKIPRFLKIFLSEVVPVVLFAFAHLYLGIISVANALVCGVILRLCCKKNNGPFQGVVAHFMYNVFSLFLAVI